MLRSLLLLSVICRFGGAAIADTAYIEPSSFTPRLNQVITVETSFNDYCCVPKYPVRSDRFTVIHPDGRSVEPDRLELFANSSVIEQKITQEGTTRITTGERLGRKGGEYVRLGGQYFLVNSDDAEPIPLKRISLALNIPTFINLYGYGYENIYELAVMTETTNPDVNWVQGEIAL